jgi:hypothetical protein
MQFLLDAQLSRRLVWHLSEPATMRLTSSTMATRPLTT